MAVTSRSNIVAGQARWLSVTSVYRHRRVAARLAPTPPIAGRKADGDKRGIALHRVASLPRPARTHPISRRALKAAESVPSSR
jgi:hypothetical protein